MQPRVFLRRREQFLMRLYLQTFRYLRLVMIVCIKNVVLSLLKDLISQVVFELQVYRP